MAKEFESFQELYVEIEEIVDHIDYLDIDVRQAVKIAISRIFFSASKNSAKYRDRYGDIGDATKIDIRGIRIAGIRFPIPIDHVKKYWFQIEEIDTKFFMAKYLNVSVVLDGANETIISYSNHELVKFIENGSFNFSIQKNNVTVKIRAPSSQFMDKKLFIQGIIDDDIEKVED